MSNRKRDRKEFYKKNKQEGARADELFKGVKGFLVTCDMKKEKACVKEVMNMLEETFANFYPHLDVAAIVQREKLKKGAMKQQKPEKLVAEEGKNKEEESKSHSNIDDQIKQDALAEKANRVFYQFNTGTPGILFFKVIEEMHAYVDVKKMGISILKEVKEKKQSQTRFACRFLPTDFMVKAKLEHLQSQAPEVIKRYFRTGEPKTWSLEFKKKNNHSINKQQVLEVLYACIDREEHKIDLKNAEIPIIVENIRDLMVFAVAPYFKEFKRYNLRELCGESYTGPGKQKQN